MHSCISRQWHAQRAVAHRPHPHVPFCVLSSSDQWRQREVVEARAAPQKEGGRGKPSGNPSPSALPWIMTNFTIGFCLVLKIMSFADSLIFLMWSCGINQISTSGKSWTGIAGASFMHMKSSKRGRQRQCQDPAGCPHYPWLYHLSQAISCFLLEQQQCTIKMHPIEASD